MDVSTKSLGVPAGGDEHEIEDEANPTSTPEAIIAFFNSNELHAILSSVILILSELVQGDHLQQAQYCMSC